MQKRQQREKKEGKKEKKRDRWRTIPIFHMHEHVQQRLHQLCLEQTNSQRLLACFHPP